MAWLEKTVNTTKYTKAEEMEQLQQARALHMTVVDVKQSCPALQNVSKSLQKELKSGLLAKMNNFFFL
jgi:hypothetical protein